MQDAMRDSKPGVGPRDVTKRISAEPWLAEQRLKTGVRPLFKNGTPPKKGN